VRTHLAKQDLPSPFVQKTSKAQGIAISFLAIGYVLIELFNLAFLENLVSILIITVIIGILPRMNGAVKNISVLLLVAGITFMIYYDATLQQWLESVRSNLTLVAIFLFSPLMGIPVRTGNYVDSLKLVFSKNMNRPTFFFLGTTLLTHVLGTVLNVGSISIVHELSKASKIKAARMVANAINRGFITTVFWSPYFSAMALILSTLPLKWGSIVLYSIGLAVIANIVSFLIEKPYKLRVQDEESGSIHDGNNLLKKEKRKVVELFFLLFLMIAGILVVEMFTAFSMTLIICLFSLIFPIIWCSGKREGTSYIKEIHTHIFTGTPRMKNEIVLFLIAGFFSSSIVHSNISDFLVDGVNGIFPEGSIAIAYLLSALIVISAVIGLHPIIVVSILASSINPSMIGFSPEFYAVLLLSSWGISNTISPATTVNNILANLFQSDLMDVSFRWNLKFALVMFMIIPLYLKLIGI